MGGQHTNLDRKGMFNTGTENCEIEDYLRLDTCSCK